ncbi:hypothetical protein Syun_021658 [Stephania yunnanensis]|uniref:Cytochrome P450 n=1 Tax=Stephania yunnanensis TaxID=152371 RepID=A0AAP0IG14_9MAGN
MHIRLGQVPTIVVSSPEAAELFLKAHDLVFASRPTVLAEKFIGYGFRGLAFSPYGAYWRNMRKLCTLELFTNAKVEMFRPMRREEVSNLVEVLKVASHAREVVCVSEMVGKVVEDMTYRMVFGSKEDRYRLKPIINEAMRLTAAFDVGDYVPFLAPLDLQGIRRGMRLVVKDFNTMFDAIIAEHTKEARKQNADFRDFIDVMLSLKDSNYMQDIKVNKDHIKAIIMDVVAAGMDTSVNVVNWAFPELLRHPKLMKRVQAELREVVGMDRMVEETDLPKLNFLNMVIKETMRLHPVAPLLLPRESIEDITINGYFIPKKSQVFINIWTIGRDPNVWSENAEEFNPDRFVDVDMDIHGRDFQFVPFGSGRRGCPGVQLGLTVVKLILAQLLHCFNWELPNCISSCDLDMKEKFALSMSRESPLLADACGTNIRQMNILGTVVGGLFSFPHPTPPPNNTTEIPKSFTRNNRKNLNLSLRLVAPVDRLVPNRPSRSIVSSLRLVVLAGLSAVSALAVRSRWSPYLRLVVLPGLSAVSGLAVSLVSPSRRAGLRHRRYLPLSLVSDSDPATLMIKSSSAFIEIIHLVTVLRKY